MIFVFSGWIYVLSNKYTQNPLVQHSKVFLAISVCCRIFRRIFIEQVWIEVTLERMQWAYSELNLFSILQSSHTLRNTTWNKKTGVLCVSFDRKKLVHTAVVIIIIKMTIILYRKCHKCALNFLTEESDETNQVIWFIQREILYLIAVFFN